MRRLEGDDAWDLEKRSEIEGSCHISETAFGDENMGDMSYEDMLYMYKSRKMPFRRPLA